MVRARSHGTVVAIVKRGPQWVQFVNGYRNRRACGSSTSAAHAAHCAASGITVAAGAASPRVDSRIANPGDGGSSTIAPRTISSIRASGGRPAASAARNRSRAAASPPSASSTPSLSFFTHPDMPSSAARRATVGRNPTP